MTQTIPFFLDFTFILKGFLIAWFITSFEPLQSFLTKYIKPFIFSDYIANGISCIKCVTFWLLLFWGAFKFDDIMIFDAITGAIIAMSFDKIINSFKTYL